MKLQIGIFHEGDQEWLFFYFDTRKGCGKFLVLCQRLGRQIIPLRMLCSSHSFSTLVYIFAYLSYV